MIEAFENKSVSRKVDLLRQLVQLKLSECDSMEDYVNKMILTSIQVSSAGLKLDDEITASLMLAGLPEEFLPMVLAVENSNDKLTIDTVKSVLLQDVKFDSNNSGGAFYSKNNKYSNSKKYLRCHGCGEVGHFINSCVKRKNNKYNKNKNNVLLTSFIANKNKTSDWFIDSGAHMTIDDSYLKNKSKTSQGSGYSR